MIHVRVPMYDEMPFAARTTYESIGLDERIGGVDGGVGMGTDEVVDDVVHVVLAVELSTGQFVNGGLLQISEFAVHAEPQFSGGGVP